MGRKCRLSPDAERDLDQVFEFVLLNDGIDAAAYVVAGIENACAKVARMPGIGHRREDYTTRDLRFYTIWSYYIVYKPDSDPLEIVRVVHSARDISAALAEDP